jgi:hypothetical protein
MSTDAVSASPCMFSFTFCGLIAKMKTTSTNVSCVGELGARQGAVVPHLLQCSQHAVAINRA